MLVKPFSEFCGGDYRVTEIRELESLFTRKLNHIDDGFMVRPVTDDEIRLAIFDIPDDKAPSPDGFSAKFLRNHGLLLGLNFLKLRMNILTRGSSCKVSTTPLSPLLQSLETLLMLKISAPLLAVMCSTNVSTRF